jgi:hypothetical protein
MLLGKSTKLEHCIKNKTLTEVLYNKYCQLTGFNKSCWYDMLTTLFLKSFIKSFRTIQVHSNQTATKINLPFRRICTSTLKIHQNYSFIIYSILFEVRFTSSLKYQWKKHILIFFCFNDVVSMMIYKAASRFFVKCWQHHKSWKFLFYKV